MIRKLITGSITIGCFSCGNSEVKVETHAKQFDWTVQYGDSAKTTFLSVINNISSSTVNQFIHPSRGLYLINSAGAIPSAQNLKEIEGVFPIDFSEAKQAELPQVNCDSKTFWSKDGCFFSEENQIAVSKILEHCNLNPEEKMKAEESAGSIVFSAINTKLNTRYYFSQLEGKWYITFIDVRKPCSA